MNEYKQRGDYHRNIDKTWSYYPIYKEKMKYVRRYIDERALSVYKILDIGCGEGVLVEELRDLGFTNTKGIDLNYNSEHVEQGNALKMKYKDSSFDMVICLDLIEHLSFEDQDKLLKELRRVLKKTGYLIMSIPNLAHLASRIAFMFSGNLIRTSSANRHIGDRPINEYIELIKENDFHILQRKGIFPTFLISSILTYCIPQHMLPLHKFLNNFLAYPNWCFSNIFVLEVKQKWM